MVYQCIVSGIKESLGMNKLTFSKFKLNLLFFLKEIKRIFSHREYKIILFFLFLYYGSIFFLLHVLLGFNISSIAVQFLLFLICYDVILLLYGYEWILICISGIDLLARFTSAYLLGQAVTIQFIHLNLLVSLVLYFCIIWNTMKLVKKSNIKTVSVSDCIANHKKIDTNTRHQKQLISELADSAEFSSARFRKYCREAAKCFSECEDFMWRYLPLGKISAYNFQALAKDKTLDEFSKRLKELDVMYSSYNEVIRDEKFFFGLGKIDSIEKEAKLELLTERVLNNLNNIKSCKIYMFETIDEFFPNVLEFKNFGKE